MLQWVRQGLGTGIKTTAYPQGTESAAGVTCGFPAGGAYPPAAAAELVALCPTQALSAVEHGVAVEAGRCVHCYRCARRASPPLAWQGGWEWARELRGNRLGDAYRRSASVQVVDAGDCGACLREVKQLNNPYYNVHRLGIFLTPTPRHADILLVVGPVTDAMRTALQKAYDAMPTPRCVVAAGACALTGSVFGSSFASAGGVSHVLPVDVEVPGHPPPPLAILHGLLVALQRRPAAPAEVRTP